MTDDIPLPRPPMAELAAAGDAADFGWGPVGELLPYQDSVLAGRGNDLRLYETIKRDDQVQSTWQQRVRAATAREWDVEPGGPSALDKAAAEDLKVQLQAIDLDRVMGKMANGLFYGYGVGECLYRAEGGRIRLDAVKVRRARRFRFDRGGRLRLLRSDHPAGEVMPDNKFWVFTAGADDDDNPYGLGLGHYLYWPVWLKRNGVRFWSLFLEKFALPTTLGKAPGGATDEERRKLLTALRAITRDSAVVVPEGVDIQLIESVRQSGADFGAFVGRMDAAISKIVLSQTLTTDSGGSRAQGEIHQAVKLEVVKGDNDLMCESFNSGPATWLTRWNFPGAAPPRLWRDHAEPEDLEKRSKRDTDIRRLGYRPTQDYITMVYGPGWLPDAAPAEPAPETRPPPDPAEFAESPPPPARDAADHLTDQALPLAAPAMDSMIDRIRAVIDGAASLDQVPALLAERFGDVAEDELAGLIGEAMVLADLHGRRDLADGDG